MKTITNEHGNSALSIGEYGSPISMKQKYPKSIDFLIGQVISFKKYDYGYLKDIAIEDCNVEAEDIPFLLKAVFFYTDYLFKI